MFRERGVEIVAISTDSIEDAGNMVRWASAQYPVLSDSDTTVALEYGVFDLLGDGVAAPAVFILGKAGEILWSQVGENIADRPSAGEILSQLGG